MSRQNFGERLVDDGLLTQAQLDLALREQKQSGGLLGPTLVRLGLIQADTLSAVLAKDSETRAVSLTRLPIALDVIKLVPQALARRFKAVPISRVGKTLTVALADPFNVVAIDTLNQVTGMVIEVVTAPEQDILNCLSRYYRTGDTIEESIDKILALKGDEPGEPIDDVLTRLEETDRDAPVVRLVNEIITRAINLGASDIHFEPEAHLMRIRTRIDGDMCQDELIPKSMLSAVTTRMKILAEMDLSETRKPQDGRASISVGGRQVNLRVSSLPTNLGENLVARILDPNAQVLSLPSLGFAPDVEAAFLAAANKPFGVILVTGPTGSGKSTTLYTVLQEVAKADMATFTLEDPIEYRMPMLRQTQIREDVGLTFGSGLRTLLRQDPDIILVGETRDTETAQLMVRAALTGHLVLSTLHTNDAAGAIPRLIDMGVEPFLLPSSLICVLAQRLVRTLCKVCQREVEDPQAIFDGLELSPPPGFPVRLWRNVGCPQCKLSGYQGRVGVFELMVLDARFQDPIMRKAGAPEYTRLARERGMRAMFDDGLLKAVQSVTTIEELLRVARPEPK